MRRHKHSLSHSKLFSADMGQLLPIGLVEVLPGDSIQQATSVLVRMSPMLAPVMHRVDVRIHHWFVPMRLLWDNWESFITGGEDNDDASVFPTISLTTASGAVGNLADYFGCPIVYSGTMEVSALPFRAYSLIWNEWYRDQDLQDPVVVSKADGADSTTNRGFLRCSWAKDYFTTARPWPAKGGNVGIPIELDVVGDGGPMRLTSLSDAVNRVMQINTSNDLIASGAAPAGTDSVGMAGSTTGVIAEGFLNVEDLREGLAMERFAEARARYGSRYTEYLRYLGVRSSDARLQRPEYLGGGRQSLQVSEVLQTGVTTDGDDSEGVGNLKGHGIGALRSNRYRRFFEEHGYIISVFSVRPKTMYNQGLERTWNRRTKEDFYQRELEHIGQQEVLNKELYAPSADPDGVFGYNDRYSEYRYMSSNVAGEFRESTLDFWHFGRIFASDPALNSSFITCTPTKRCFAVQTNDVLWCMANHSIQARRLVSKNARGATF